ncbi:glyoxylase-like metal-dependent hydrolase (beta-lactamase superfamily II) [Kineococcus xinjiangensis]|uniref:Glyoxylase-like metal-dependent hydrolase (Beta-lactamase superfamily II) n=1 Tax=Kineococcus xinjiangensis TaxID=512762 RepID=A0A2S6IPB9_9ACTN|nr:MBL fold metallo-hydrolase [Kineococcus xinjiangensis]PPK96102.1 glyoxylase-like metal-dependent hydrolase (beta-lactamase superfamily II) [Kineococcus xinjiangensis]
MVDPDAAGEAVLRLPGAEVRTVRVSEMDNACYLVTCTGTGETLLVDAAADAPALLRALARVESARLAAVVTTHGHWDHHRALPDVVAATGAPTAAGAEDAGDLPVPPDRLLRHGDEVRVGDLRLEVLHLRGHTPGSVALLLEPAGAAPQLFTGDSLFPGGPGKTRSPEAFTSLMDDLEERVFARLGDGTAVRPGHGEPTTLGAERAHLPQWRARGW